MGEERCQQKGRQRKREDPVRAKEKRWLRQSLTTGCSSRLDKRGNYHPNKCSETVFQTAPDVLSKPWAMRQIHARTPWSLRCASRTSMALASAVELSTVLFDGDGHDAEEAVVAYDALSKPPTWPQPRPDRSVRVHKPIDSIELERTCTTSLIAPSPACSSDETGARKLFVLPAMQVIGNSFRMVETVQMWSDDMRKHAGHSLLVTAFKLDQHHGLINGPSYQATSFQGKNSKPLWCPSPDHNRRPFPGRKLSIRPPKLTPGRSE